MLIEHIISDLWSSESEHNPSISSENMNMNIPSRISFLHSNDDDDGESTLFIRQEYLQCKAPQKILANFFLRRENPSSSSSFSSSTIILRYEMKEKNDALHSSSHGSMMLYKQKYIQTFPFPLQKFCLVKKFCHFS